MAEIRIEDLSRRFGTFTAVEGSSFTIEDGSFFVMLGPSGCGKTTLLKSMNRLVELSDDVQVAGRVLIDGIDIYDPTIDVTEVRKRTGLLAQRPFPLPMSIRDNVAYGMKIHGTKKGRETDRAVQHYLELAGLWDEVKDRLKSPAARLSIGQQQRLCLARGLAVEPEIILGDEPTSALDPISAQHIEGKLHELKEKYTIVLVTHTLRQARRLADYVIFMYLGEVVEAGIAHEVFAQPQQARTRQFIEGAIG